MMRPRKGLSKFAEVPAEVGFSLTLSLPPSLEFEKSEARVQ